MAVRVYAADTGCLSDPVLFDRLYETVSRNRKAKIEMLCSKDAKLRSLGVGILLKRALAEKGINEADAVFCLDEYKKPYIEDHPEIFFNLSHSGDYSVCAVADTPVGCDIEKIRKVNLKLADKFFADDENGYIKGMFSQAERTKAFFEIWTLKESFVKAVGKGLKIPLSGFSVLSGEAVYGKDKYCLVTLPIDPGYKAACCFRGEKEEIETERVDLSE